MKESTTISTVNNPAMNAPGHLPRWLVATLGVPLIGKIAGANAIIVGVAVAVAVMGGMVGQGSQLWVVLLGALGLGLGVNAILVFIALRPLKDLEETAQRVSRGELGARVTGSVVADAGIQRVGNTLNILLDKLDADRARMRTLADDVIQAGDRERANIARELHDSTAQTLAALLLELTVLSAQSSDPELGQRITKIRSIVSDVLEEVRLLAHTVHPRVLDDLGLGAALQLLARESLERSSVRVTYTGPTRVTSIEGASASALYRVAQEAVGNAIRHARAKSITIRLTVGASEAELEIADDGMGFAPEVVEQRRPGLGLFTMRERAALVGGRLTLHSGVGQGTRVSVIVPARPVKEELKSHLETVGTGHSWQRREEV